jgi:hypothetical protein
VCLCVNCIKSVCVTCTEARDALGGHDVEGIDGLRVCVCVYMCFECPEACVDSYQMRCGQICVCMCVCVPSPIP